MQQPSAAAGARRRRSRIARLVLFGVAAVGMLAVVIVASTAAIVLSGAAEIGLIRDRIQTALAQRLGPGFEVGVGRTVMLVDPVLGLAVDIKSLKVHRADGVVALSIPAIRLAVDPLSLLRFRLALTKAELKGPSITLVRDDRGYRLDGAQGPVPAAPDGGDVESPRTGEPAGGFSGLAVAVEGFDALLGDLVAADATAGLTLDLTDGSVTLRDAASGTLREVDSIDLHVTVGDENGDLVAEGSAEGAAGRWSATLRRHVDAETGGRRVSMSFSQVAPGDIFPDLAVSEGALSIDTPLYAAVEFVLGSDGIEGATGRLDLGAGVFRYGDGGDSILLDEATLRARWDVAGRQIVIEPSSIHIGDTGGTFTGTVQDADGGRFAFAFESREAILAPRDSGEEPVAAELIELSGSADLGSSVLDLDRVIIQTRDGSFAAAGRLGFAGETPSLALAAELTPMPIATWKQMWPPFLAPGARRWALDAILGGRITSARFDANVPAGVLFRGAHPQLTAEALRLDLRLEDVTLRTFGGLPPISGASGRAVLAGSTFRVDVTSGVVRTPSGGTAEVTGGAFAIDDVFDPGGDGVVEVQLTGSAGVIGEIADSEPFQVLGRRGLTPEDLSGNTDASVSVRFPLDLDGRGDPGAEVDWRVVVTGTDLASRKPQEGRTYSDANVTISVTRDEVRVDGTARIDGVPAAVSFAQPLSGDGAEAPGARQAASLALDRDARLRLGLDIENIVSGTVDAQVRSLAAGGEHYDLDLQRTRLVIPGVGWSKGVGVPATMKFDVIPEEGGSRIENMELSGEGFGFKGSARLADGKGLVSASIRKFRLRPGDDVSFELTSGGGRYSIVAEGASFDVRGVIAELKGDVEDGGDTSSVSVEATLRKLRGYGDRAISDAAVSFTATDGGARKLRLSGSLRGGTVFVDYIDDLSSASLDASAADAGAVFDFLDIYGRIGGGHLAITAQRPAPTGPLAGTLSMTNFAILNEPAMEEVVSRARPRGGSRIDTARMNVEQMDAVFRYTGDEIFVDEAFLRGAAMGATFNGVFDLARSFVSISGTFIPVYGINNAFSRVPVVGRILGGENAEGLIGVTFKVEGPIDSPRTFVNPLSAVAPGILRKIFEFR